MNERFADGCIQSVDDKRSVMVRGAISIRGKSKLIIAQGNINANAYQNNIVTQGLLPFLNALPNPGQMEFQHDAATAHTARTTNQFLHANHLRVMGP